MSVVKDSEIRTNLDKIVQFINLALIILGIILISFGIVFRTAQTPEMDELSLYMFIGGGISLVISIIGYVRHLNVIRNYKKI